MQGAFIVNCSFSPLVSLDDWPFHIGGGLGGSGVHAVLQGRDSEQSELALGVGWQVRTWNVFGEGLTSGWGAIAFTKSVQHANS